MGSMHNAAGKLANVLISNYSESRTPFSLHSHSILTPFDHVIPKVLAFSHHTDTKQIIHQTLSHFPDSIIPGQNQIVVFHSLLYHYQSEGNRVRA